MADGLYLTSFLDRLRIARFMVKNITAAVDFWRLAASRSCFEGVLQLSQLRRLRSVLIDAEGECGYTLKFDYSQSLRLSLLHVDLRAQLPLRCQRSLSRFIFPVTVKQALGMIRHDSEESRLPPGHEPLLVPEHGCLPLADVVEDELLMAVPIVPVAPGSEPVLPCADEGVSLQPNPFAVLAGLKT